MININEHPEGSLTELPRIKNISKEDFVRDYLRPSKPVVITEGAKDWPATSKWSFEYFKSLNADFKVNLEEGNVMQTNTTFREVSFNDYLGELEHPDKTDGRIAYLSVFNIFKKFPQLSQDVDFSLIADYKVVNRPSGWIGPGGTVTGYHIDWADNILVQVVGSKLIKLVSPEQRSRMYPSSKYDSNTLMSSVDADNYDAKRYPEFAKVDAMYTTLKPGEMIFMPRGWWHYVRGLEPSISVNNFGIDWRGFVRDKPREYAKKYLHKAGLYGKECTCHMVVDGRRVAR